jgi:hypothetical protein
MNGKAFPETDRQSHSFMIKLKALPQTDNQTNEIVYYEAQSVPTDKQSEY